MIKLIRIKTYILVYIPFFILFYRDVKERDHGYYSCRQNTDKANIQTFPLIVQGKIFSSSAGYKTVCFGKVHPRSIFLQFYKGYGVVSYSRNY